jgi:hypothetical protein
MDLFRQSNATLVDILFSDSVPCLCSERWRLAYIGFIGFVLVYAVRINFSVAILCMVKRDPPLELGNNVSLAINGTSDGWEQDGCTDAFAKTQIRSADVRIIKYIYTKSKCCKTF